MKLSPDFIGLDSCVVGSGASVSLWGDVWNFGLLKLEFPQFFFFCKKPKHLGGCISFLGVSKITSTCHSLWKLLSS